MAFLTGYFSAAEACQEHSWLDDILAGVVVLKTAGDTGTRPLSRKVLFCLLQRCEVVSTLEVGTVLAGRAKPRTVERYAAAARVASKAITIHLPTVRSCAGIREARTAIDAPALADAEKAEVASLQRIPAPVAAATFDPLRSACDDDPRLGQEPLARAMRRGQAARLVRLGQRDRLRRTESFRNLREGITADASTGVSVT
jgi:hypothetical protein